MGLCNSFEESDAPNDAPGLNNYMTVSFMNRN